jgi:hypothetical protein
MKTAKRNHVRERWWGLSNIMIKPNNRKGHKKIGRRMRQFRNLSQIGKPFPMKSVFAIRLIIFIVEENRSDLMISAGD